MYRLRHFVCVCSLLALSAPVFAESGPVLPLKISESARYLTDQGGKPVLVVGDTAWSMIVQLKESDIDHYLADRQKKGFNSIIVNLLEHKFTTKPPKTKAGLAPFNSVKNFSSPNPRYFDYAHKIVKKAGERGIVVWLCPAYLGYGGGEEGWFQEMKRSGPQTLRKYGQFVGKRFKDLPNIIWVEGGDFAPREADRWTSNEVAEGIREAGATQLQTAHAARTQSAAPAFGDPKWLDINTTYTDRDKLFQLLIADYRRKPVRPFVLLEGYYENENKMTPEFIRRQAYGAMLCGACGQFFGNSPVWCYDGPAIFKTNVTWQQALNQQGSRDMVRLRELFENRPWYLLVPDLDHKVVTASTGQDMATIVAASTPDGKLAMAYISAAPGKSRTLTVDMGQFASSMAARWYNPASGKFSAAGDGLGNTGSHSFAIPGDNGNKSNDWVLVLEAK